MCCLPACAATSEELEQLLQQLAQYEAHLLEGDAQLPEQPSQRAPDAASDMGTSVSNSLSWSQTLAGLASLLPTNDGAVGSTKE